MKYPISELYDRYSIELLKFHRASADNTTFTNELVKAIHEYEYIQDYIDQLYEINGRIWDLESDIRRGKENELGLEEVGRRAIMIRNINAERIKVKQQIAKYFDQYVERKYNHASE